jgi:hypothetical protein
MCKIVEEIANQKYDAGHKDGIIETIVKLVLANKLSFEEGVEESGLSEAEFRTAVLAANPAFAI